ncbi:MAG: M42 family metallopeptidase [Ruminococcaceae bacterium]|nr:M42 family metallopeptidase [Oscillospiraceae bacterium]
MLKHLEALVALEGISGHEKTVREYILAALKEYPVEFTYKEDSLGNLLVEVKGAEPAKQRVLFNAHMDEVGLIVTNVTEDGLLRFATAGGIDEKVLVGRTVTVNGHTGVIGCGAIHLCSGEEKNRAVAKDRLMVDIGASSREEAEAVVTIGDPVVFDSDMVALYNDRFKARALDDRAGCALLLSLLEKPLPFDIQLAFTVQEELGCRGGAVAAFTMQPDISVTVETTTASDIAGTQAGQEVCHMGDGAVVSFMDGRTFYDQPLYKQIRALADANGIKTQTKTTIAGGNDAGAVQAAGHGARVAAVSMPCRYIHSAGSVLSESDIEETCRLLRLLAETLPGESV